MKQSTKGMNFYAYRYYVREGGEWYVAIYLLDPDDCPHDYTASFSQKEWRKICGKAPRKEEIWLVKLTATFVKKRSEN